MDYYIRKTSVEIEGDYQCYQKNFIELFSIPVFSKEEREHIIKADEDKVLKLLIKKFELKSTSFLSL